MLLSMTGFGKAECELPGKKVTIEIKSLNSKMTDISTRLPLLFKEKELEVRNEINRKLIRGKIDCYISVEPTSEEISCPINKNVVRNYISQLKEIAKEHNMDVTEHMIGVAMRLPEVLKVENKELTEQEWNTVLQTLQAALEDVETYRTREGHLMETDIISRIHLIMEKLEKIKPLEKARTDTIRNRINQSLRNLQTEESYDPNRFEQEMIFYLEKMDITEEQVRLASHCNYFLETLSDAEPAGKKLGFITQEMLREINTLGSKANDTSIQRLVVEMKDELEKIREQLNNIL